MNFNYMVSYKKNDNLFTGYTLCSSFDDAFKFAIQKREETIKPIEIYKLKENYLKEKLVCFFHGKF